MEKQKAKIIEEINKAKTVKRPRGNPGGLSLYYKDVIAAFDIETSKDPETENAFMYAWGFGVNDKYIMGRTWDEFIELIQDLKRACQGAAIPVYVHNLSFDFVFCSGILNFMPEDVLCGKEREIIKAYSYPLEFRCSYKLTGLSLETLTKEYDVENKKLSGEEFNYNKTRYPWTPLNEYEQQYLENDVMGLIQVIKKLLAVYNDSIYTVPITKNGYVRRQLKKRMRTYPWEYVNKQRINLDIYKMLNIAMRGGIVHANRYYTGEIIDGPGVDPWDISSAYPAACVYGQVPIGKWKFVEPDIDDLIMYMYARNKAILASLKFKNLRLKNPKDPFPYIAENKSDIPKDSKRKVDNGRIIEIKGELSGVYTDLDLKIIFEQYIWDDVEILQLAINKYGPLPNQIREYILELYEKKTKLKGTGKRDIYASIKTEINGVFGTLAEDPGKIYYQYVDGEYIKEDITVEKAALRKIEKTNIPYSWGVWIPNIVRVWVQDVLNELGPDAIYVDTDGVKVFNGINIPFKKFNAKIDDLAAQIPGAQAVDADGVIHTLGTWECEGHYEEFITLGTKKYAYKENGEIKITTAGVNKKKGGQELGTLKNYREGFTFYEAGGREAIYNDHVDLWVEREGRPLHITRNVYLKQSTFTLGMTAEYKRLMLMPKFIDKAMKMYEERTAENV